MPISTRFRRPGPNRHRWILSVAVAQLCIGDPLSANSDTDSQISQETAATLIQNAISTRVGHKVDMGTDINRPAGGLSRSSKRIIGLLGGLSGLMIARKLHPKLAVREDLSAVAEAISSDGRFAIVSLHSGDFGLWDLQKGSEIARLKGPTGGVSSLAVRSDGRLFAFGLSDGSVSINDLSASFVIRPTGGAAVSAIAADSEFKHLVVALSDGTAELWDVADRRLSAATRIEVKAAALRFEDDHTILGLTSGGAALQWDTKANEVTRLARGKLSLASAHINAASKTAIALQGDQVVFAFDLATGKSTRLFTASEALRAVIPVSADSVLAIGKLGTLLLLNSHDGHRMAQLVTTARGWAVLDNAGRFDGSTRGLSAISWSQGAESFDIQQFAAEYFEPAILSKLVAGTALDTGNLASPETGMRPPPALKVILPPEQAHTGGKPFPVVVLAEDGGGGVQDLRLFHNGKVVDAGSMIQTRDYDDGTNRIRASVFRVRPKAGLNSFRASATNGDNILGWSARIGAPFSGKEEKGTLHVLAVGINAYSNGAPKLNLAVLDATGVVDALAKPSAVFGKIASMTLLDAAADRTAILHALDEIASTSNPEDTVLVYLAGHGFAVGTDEWVFGPVGVQIATAESLRATGVSATEIQEALVKVNARRVVLAIDACQSASAFGPFLKQRSSYLRLLSDLSRSTGIVVYAATKELEAAQELEELRHGVFTYVLIRGLAGEAHSEDTDVITAFGLADYLQDAVPLLVRQQEIDDQDSTAFELGADFPIH